MCTLILQDQEDSNALKNGSFKLLYAKHMKLQSFIFRRPKTNTYITYSCCVHPHNQYVPLVQNLWVLVVGQVLVIWYTHLRS